MRVLKTECVIETTTSLVHLVAGPLQILEWMVGGED